ncbi:MAG: PQQ-binding-like beta-propeller repeat protein [Candidatus Methanofastidiosum sp.]|nr:PQQ-binding-like beta-propeller repeat protein [Methanofastidiosum sp.]
MKKLITLLLIFGILASSGVIFAEETSDPVIWKSKINSWVPFVTTTSNGSFTAASSLDGSFYIFDKSGNVLWTYTPAHRVTSISLSEDISQVSVVTGERVYVYNSSGEFLTSYKSVKGGFMTITPDGEYIGGSSSNVYAMVYKDGRPSWDYRTEGKVNDLSLTPDGETLAVASSDNHVYLLRSGLLLWKHDVKAPVISVAVTPDSSYLVCGTGNFEFKEGETSKDFKIYLFDGTGKLLWSKVIGHTVSSVSITPDGSYIAIGSWDKKVHIYSKSGEHLREFKTEGNVWSVSITPDGKNVVAGSTDAYVYFLDVESMSKPEKSSSFNPIYIAILILIIFAAGALIYTKKLKKK